MRYLQPCEVPKSSSYPRMYHPCVWPLEGSGYPQVLSLVLGGGFEILASTLGKLDKGAEGPQHINRTGISFCLLGDSVEALPVPYRVICGVALGYNLLTKLSETNSTAVRYGLDVYLLA